MSEYLEQVEAQVEANDGAGGWDNGPESICAEMMEEIVDLAAWGRGLDGYPMSSEQQHRIEVIVSDAALIFDAVNELRDTYRQV